MFASMIRKVGSLKNKAMVSAGLMILSVDTALASASGSAYDSDQVNSQAKGVAEFLIDLLQGWVGYTLSLAIFFVGIFTYFKDKNLWGTLACFGIAVLIVFVPGMLEGFFQVS